LEGLGDVPHIVRRSSNGVVGKFHKMSAKYMPLYVADIFTDSVALGYTFTEPPDVPMSQSSIGPHETRLMSAILPHLVPDAEIQDILDGNGKALFVWGVVHYDDVFGRPHFTQFCQRITWLKDRSNIFGLYDGRFGLSN
jgi:hypothetical protein